MFSYSIYREEKHKSYSSHQQLLLLYSHTLAKEDNSFRNHIRQPKRAPGMARPFTFAALCQRAHPLKRSLAEFIFVSRVRKTAKKSSLAKKFVSRVTCQPRYHCISQKKHIIFVISFPRNDHCGSVADYYIRF